MIRNPERLKWVKEMNLLPPKPPKITLGKDTRIHPTVVLGEEGFSMERLDDGSWINAVHQGDVIIEDDVWIGEFSIIRRSTMPDTATIIGKGTKIRNHVNVGHNCKIGRHNFIGPHVCFSGSVEVGDLCWIAPHVVIKEHVKLGNEVIIGMGAVVNRDIPDGETVVGAPAVPIEYHGNYVHPSFVHGENFKIGKYNHIHENVKVGDDVTIRSYVELRPGTIIGDWCYIDSGVKSSGQNKIGNNVTIRYDAIIARNVIIEDDVFISPQVMTEYLTHKREKKGGTVIGKGTFVGTDATISFGVKICPEVIIGSKALVKRDILEPGIYVGIPARLMRRKT